MKLHYLLGLCLLLPPLQATATAPESFAEIAIIASGFGATASGVWLLTDPRVEKDDRYRGLALTAVGLSTIIFSKQLGSPSAHTPKK